MRNKDDWAFGPEGFYYEGTSNRGVLLIHGLTGSAAEMRLLGEHLNGLGYHVLAPLLPGHGTTAADLAKTKEKDFCEAVRLAYHELEQKAGVEHIYLVGHSMGGLLSLDLAEQGLGEKLVLMATPVHIYQKLGEFAKFIHLFKKYTDRGRKGFRYKGKLICMSYQLMPLKALARMLDIRNRVVKKAGLVRVPTLLIYSNDETTVKPKSSNRLKKKLVGSPEVKQVWLTESGHTIMLDRKRETVFVEIENFFKEAANE